MEALCVDLLLFTMAYWVVFVSFVLLALHVHNCLDSLKVTKKTRFYLQVVCYFDMFSELHSMPDL